MIHGIKKFDNREHGKHTTYCGKTMSPNHGYSLNSEEVDCPRCKSEMKKSVDRFHNRRNVILERIREMSSNRSLGV